MNIQFVRAAIAGVAFTMLFPCIALGQSPVTVQDAISMVRIQEESGDSGVAAFSPNGRSFVSVVWHGDLTRDVNVYTILRFDLDRHRVWHGPKTVFSIDFDQRRIRFGDNRTDQHATPVTAVRFLSDNVTIAFIGIFHNGTQQVYTLNTVSGTLRQLTHAPYDVKAFETTEQGRLVFYATSAGLGTEATQDRTLWENQGVSVSQDPGWVPSILGGVFLQQLGRFTGGNYPWWYRTEPPAKYILLSRRFHTLSFASPANSFSFPPIIQIAPSGKMLAVLSAWMIPLKSRTKSLIDMYDRLRMSLELIDFRTGSTRSAEVTKSGAHASFMFWSPDSTSVIIPESRGALAGSTYRVVSVGMGKSTGSFTVSRGWHLLGWANPTTLVFTRAGQLATVEKRNGVWGGLNEVGAGARFGLNDRYASSLSGRYIAGVKDDLTVAPEIAVYDRITRKTSILTDLNPQLRKRTFGEVSRIFWPGTDGDALGHFGYLIKPVGYIKGKRYPLIFLLKDEPYDANDRSYLIDGQEQLGGFAAQSLANDGFMVLLSPEPRLIEKDITTPAEPLDEMAHVESGVAYLDRLGLIDPARVAISGWSRAAFETDYLIAHSKIRFAAASDIDGGGNYHVFMLECNLAPPQDLLPDHQVDLHLRDIHTPLMSEEHGTASLLSQAEGMDALSALEKPFDLYLYPDAPHNLKSPVQRYFSLMRNIDWYRFWLQGYEDPNPAKAAQYRHWEGLRKLQQADAVKAAATATPQP